MLQSSERMQRSPLTRLSPAMLTPRRREVACLLVQGLTPAEVAERLFLSEYTIHEHIRHLYEDLDCHTRAQLVAIVLRAEICTTSRK